MTTIPRIANKNARAYVMAKKPFNGSNLFAQLQKIKDSEYHNYTVYSYGNYYPLYVYDAQSGRWFENKDRVSRTTSKHKSQTRPDAFTTLLGTSDMRFLSWNTLHNLISKRVNMSTY